MHILLNQIILSNVYELINTGRWRQVLLLRTLPIASRVANQGHILPVNVTLPELGSQIISGVEEHIFRHII